MRCTTRLVNSCLVLSSLAVTAAPVRAQTPCQEPIGPDLVVADITTPANYNAVDGVEALFLGFKILNTGTVWADYQYNQTTHPVYGQALYRLKTDGAYTRIEEVGQSWVRHAFFALSSGAYCTCTPTDGSHLGVGCADTLSASAGGSGQSVLGPRWQVNAFDGSFPFPAANPPFSGNARRLLVDVADLEPADGSLPTHYFAEVHCVARDEALAGHKHNNASHRELLVASTAPGAWTFATAGTTQREQPAVMAWRDHDASVTVVAFDVKNEGRYLLAYDVTQTATATWHYEYALYNMSSDLSARSFAVPFGVNAAPRSHGFHDVDYKDGDGPGDVDFDGTDWTVGSEGERVVWSTSTYAENPSANALRWGTTYNFRFDASTPPVAGEITIGIFKPGGPDVVTVTASVPSAAGDPQEHGRRKL